MACHVVLPTHRLVQPTCPTTFTAFTSFLTNFEIFLVFSAFRRAKKQSILTALFLPLFSIYSLFIIIARLSLFNLLLLDLLGHLLPLSLFSLNLNSLICILSTDTSVFSVFVAIYVSSLHLFFIVKLRKLYRNSILI